MGCFTVIRAVAVRLCFAAHSTLAVWRVYLVTKDEIYWYLLCALGTQFIEGMVTLLKRDGHEWKWFCPSVFFYLSGVIPSIWFLELYNLQILGTGNSTFNHTGVNDSLQDLTATIKELGLEIRIPLKLSSDQWLKFLEQGLLLMLILGRWVLPKGKLTHDQLSQLLLVYIGTAADIVEFFEAFKEDVVRRTWYLAYAVLSIWTWSLLQFTMVLTATKARKDQSGLLPGIHTHIDKHQCCSSDVYGIMISIIMQDAPFLSLRLLLIFYYGVVSYTNFFFTSKNALVMLLLIYRLIMVQLERKRERRKANLKMSESRTLLMAHRRSNSTDTSLSSRQTSYRNVRSTPNMQRLQSSNSTTTMNSFSNTNSHLPQTKSMTNMNNQLRIPRNQSVGSTISLPPPKKISSASTNNGVPQPVWKMKYSPVPQREARINKNINTVL